LEESESLNSSKQTSSKKPLQIIGWAIVLGLIIALGFWGYILTTRVDKNTIAVVGGKNITQTDLNDAVYGIDFGGKGSSNVTDKQKHQFIDVMVENEIYNNAAKRLGITVTDAEVEAQAKKDISGYDSYTDKQKNMVLANTRINLLKPKVTTAVISVEEGEYVELRYDKYWTGGPDQASKTAELKASIQPIADNLFAKLKAGTMTFAQATKEVDTNKTIDIAGNPSTLGPQGGFFDKDVRIYQDPEFPENVKKMKVGEVKLFNISLIDLSDRKDGAFVIAKVTKREDNEANSVSEWIEKETKNLNVGVYYENAK